MNQLTDQQKAELKPIVNVLKHIAKMGTAKITIFREEAETLLKYLPEVE